MAKIGKKDYKTTRKLKVENGKLIFNFQFSTLINDTY